MSQNTVDKLQIFQVEVDASGNQTLKAKVTDTSKKNGLTYAVVNNSPINLNSITITFTITTNDITEYCGGFNQCSFSPYDGDCITCFWNYDNSGNIKPYDLSIITFTLCKNKKPVSAFQKPTNASSSFEIKFQDLTIDSGDFVVISMPEPCYAMATRGGDCSCGSQGRGNKECLSADSNFVILTANPSSYIPPPPPQPDTGGGGGGGGGGDDKDGGFQTKINFNPKYVVLIFGGVISILLIILFVYNVNKAK